MSDIVRRVEDILGSWPTLDSAKEAMLVLARHVQRHDELVAIQCGIDVYAECRRMPDNALDALEERRDGLRREICEETPVRCGGGFVPRAELDAANERIKTLERRIDEKTDEINRLRRQLAERDADAEVGRAIRELVTNPPPTVSPDGTPR